MLFDNDHGITEDDIITHVSHNREENAFTLFDALTHRDAEPRSPFLNYPFQRILRRFR